LTPLITPARSSPFQVKVTRSPLLNMLMLMLLLMLLMLPMLRWVC
jgi:hypothetical protein